MRILRQTTRKIVTSEHPLVLQSVRLNQRAIQTKELRMDLTTKERRRIYEEEKARLEASEQEASSRRARLPYLPPAEDTGEALILSVIFICCIPPGKIRHHGH